LRSLQPKLAWTTATAPGMPLPPKPLQSGGPQCPLVNGGANRRTFGWPTKIGNRGCNERQQPPFAALQHPASLLRGARVCSRLVSLKLDSPWPELGPMLLRVHGEESTSEQNNLWLEKHNLQVWKKILRPKRCQFDRCGLALEPLPTIIPALFTRPNAV